MIEESGHHAELVGFNSVSRNLPEFFAVNEVLKKLRDIVSLSPKIGKVQPMEVGLGARLKKSEGKKNEEKGIELNHTDESKGMGSECSSRHRKESSGGGPSPLRGGSQGIDGHWFF